jgi:hypothetical protein
MLDEQLPVEPRQLAGTLAKALGIVRYDALNALKRNPYIPFEDLSAEAAGAGLRVLSQDGVRAAVVGAERLPARPRAFTVHNADALEDGLRVQTSLAGKMRTVTWEEVEVVSAATVSETSIAHGLDGGRARDDVTAARYAAAASYGMVGVSRAARSGQDEYKPQSKSELYQVLCVMPATAEVEIRFRADQFNYDYLGERLTANSAENFRLLAADVLGRAGRALANGWARVFVETGALPPPIDKHHLARLNLWLRLRAREGL